MKPRIIVITGYGINSEEELAKCFELSGGESKIVHVNDLFSGQEKLENYQILAVPGGFSYGDDTGSGNGLANKIRNNLMDEILAFTQQDKLIIGICNGFQILTNLGLIPSTDLKYERQSVLMHNNTARLECRWVNVKMTSQKCVWTRDIDTLHLPISHGEGNFYCSPEVLDTMKKQDQITFKYVDENGAPANGQWPINPNGALEDIAGICDPTGKIFGLMPHPERFNSFTNEEGWEIKKEKLIREGKPLPKDGAGIKIFQNAISYFK